MGKKHRKKPSRKRSSEGLIIQAEVHNTEDGPQPVVMIGVEDAEGTVRSMSFSAEDAVSVGDDIINRALDAWQAAYHPGKSKQELHEEALAWLKSVREPSILN